MRRFYSDEVSEDTREAVVYYFDYFYGICPIFHPATFIRRVVNGEVDELLIDAMRASAARIISKHTGKFIDVDFIISSVQGRLLLGLDNPTLDYVSAVVVIASLCGGECKFVSYNSLSCLSGSLVTRLGWHTIDLYSTSAEGMSWEDWVTLELKRRIFWVVYEIDSYQSLLSDRPMTISETRLFVSAPGADFTWEDVTIPQAKHWPTRFDHKMSKEDILRTGSVLHTFIESCNLTALISRINNFLWDVKIGVLSKTPADRHAPNIRYLRLNPLNDLQTSGSVSSMFEYPEFCELHRLTMEWKNDLIRPEEMKGTWVANQHFSQFGSLRHRLFIMRTRYFNLYCYSVPILLSLHMANRPSFFSKNTPVNTELGSVEPATPKSVEESIEDKTIREMLATAFADRMNDGLLAYDIVEESWKICMDIVYDFVAFFDQNSDIPLDRCDQVMPFSLFTSITVFIRQIKKCRQKINGADDTTSTHDLQGYRGELSRSVSALRRLWAKLKDLGFIWRIEGMEHLLRTMQIEEVANAADLFSGLAL
ncbi:hypothetical protein GGI07_000448 [Coemansia sp. Benny D115]|nr:hypothetical protein GGI07_000448 [Coemansia sp. Benny D115]